MFDLLESCHNIVFVYELRFLLCTISYFKWAVLQLEHSNYYPCFDSFTFIYLKLCIYYYLIKIVEYSSTKLTSFLIELQEICLLKETTFQKCDQKWQFYQSGKIIWLQQQKQQNRLHLRIKMFSLSDEIEKFQKTVLTLPENIMTIDQRFLGGGIKMEDLIRQNSFIITEMRKFKSVFLNYCKLNDKIYRKIIQHEVNANDHMSRVVTLSTKIDKKVQAAMQQVKTTKQLLIRQVEKLSEQSDQNFKMLRQEVGTKVAEMKFKERVKQIIIEYQEQNASASSVAVASDNENNNILKVSTCGGGSNGKRRRGLTMEDIEAFKSQITPLIDQVSERVNVQNRSISDCNQVINNMGTKIQKLQVDSKWLSDDILTTKNQINLIKTYVDTEDQKIQQILRQTINENVWTQRFQNYHQKSIIPTVLNLSQKFYKGINQVIKQIDEGVKPKFLQINGQFTKVKYKQKNLEGRINKNEHKFEIVDKKIEDNREELAKQINQSNRKYQKMIKDELSQSKNEIGDVHKSIALINKSLLEITNTTEDLVLKKVESKLGKQMKQIRSDIQALNYKTGQLQANILLNRQQVVHVKDLVATKANYSDLVLYFDKKADKKQFKQLQQLVADSPKASNKSGFCQDGFLQDVHKKTSQQKQKIKRRRSSYTKRMTTPFNTKPEQDSSRYLHIGWTDSPQASRQFTKMSNKNNTQHLHSTLNAKNKSMRPSTANTLFLL